MARTKEEFLKQFGEGYGYPDAPRNIDAMRALDFKRLEGSPNHSSPFKIRSSSSFCFFGFFRSRLTGCVFGWGFRVGLLGPRRSHALLGGADGGCC